mmetsp:Transcript_30477/g.98231  ORF Transcript_30477/g.98231 Transcript_30477/m.98231 type:complete len:212 (-) Transcript_30477:2355-2990(-)
MCTSAISRKALLVILVALSVLLGSRSSSRPDLRPLPCFFLLSSARLKLRGGQEEDEMVGEMPPTIPLYPFLEGPDEVKLVKICSLCHTLGHLQPACPEWKVMESLSSDEPEGEQTEERQGLLAAVIQGQDSEIRRLAAQGIELDAFTVRGEENPLLAACFYEEHTSVCALIELGADVNVKNCNLLTPLHLASFRGSWTHCQSSSFSVQPQV